MKYERHLINDIREDRMRKLFKMGEMDAETLAEALETSFPCTKCPFETICANYDDCRKNLAQYLKGETNESQINRL